MKIEDVAVGSIIVLKKDMFIDNAASGWFKPDLLSKHYKNSYPMSKVQVVKYPRNEIKEIKKGTTCLVYSIEKSITHTHPSYCFHDDVAYPSINQVVNVIIDGMKASIMKSALRYFELADDAVKREPLIIMTYVVNVCVNDALDDDISLSFKKHIKALSKLGNAQLHTIHCADDTKTMLHLRRDKIEMLKQTSPELCEYITRGHNDEKKV